MSPIDLILNLLFLQHLDEQCINQKDLMSMTRKCSNLPECWKTTDCLKSKLPNCNLEIWQEFAQTCTAGQQAKRTKRHVSPDCYTSAEAHSEALEAAADCYKEKLQEANVRGKVAAKTAIHQRESLLHTSSCILVDQLVTECDGLLCNSDDGGHPNRAIIQVYLRQQLPEFDVDNC